MVAKVTGIASFKNILKCGYPAIEAVLSILPVVDEYLIADGGSDDDTLFWLHRLRDTFPQKIKVYEIPWGGQNCCAAFDASLNELISKASGDWLWEGQGDELWHNQDIFAIRNLIERLDGEGYNSIRHWCKSCSWTRIDSYRYYNVRIVRAVDGIVSDEWGDCFHFKGQPSVKESFTSHNLFPEWFDGDNVKYYHCHRFFPDNRIAADGAMFYHNAQGDPPRKEAFEHVQKINWENFPLPKKDEILECLPAIIKGLSQERKYRVREELFDRNFLRQITGIEY